MLGLFYLIRSSSCSKPRGGGWVSGRDGMRRGSRSRGGWRFRGWAGRSRCCTSHIVAQRLEHVLAEVAQILYYWLWCVVVDLATACCLTSCELRQLKVFWKLNIVHNGCFILLIYQFDTLTLWHPWHSWLEVSRVAHRGYHTSLTPVFQHLLHSVASGRWTLLDNALLQSLLDGESRREALKNLVTSFSIIHWCC